MKEKIKIFFFDILKRPSFYFFIFLAIFTIDRHQRYENSKDDHGTFYSDVYEYYKYLPDIFIKGIHSTETEIKTNRRTIGMAILYLPAFIVGDCYAKISGQKRDGYSKPYQWSIRWGSIIYCFIGLIFCRKNLLYFFNEAITLLVLICTLFGTNLFYYTYSWGELPHSYLFCLYSIFTHCTLSWVIRKKFNSLLLLGLIAGIITLIRPTGILVLLFPLLFDIKSINDIKTRFKLLAEKPIYLFWAFILFCLPIICQMFFWKHFVGQFVYYSYGNERFFFNDPQIINFLISWRKGWLIYTPIMAFALVGIVLSLFKAKSFHIFNLLYFSSTVYVLSSWWEWSFGGSFGCRALIESYAFFIFPMATFIAWVFNSRIKNIFLKYGVFTTLLVIFFLLIQLNFIQTKQCKYSIIHWSGMNKEVYRLIFLRTDFNLAEKIYLNTKYTPPNSEKMLKGDRDF
jgi:hypothetical protein